VTALYYLPFTALALGLYAALWAAGALWRRARAGAPLPWRRAALLLLSGALAAAIVAPMMLPYARVYRALGIVRSRAEIDNWSAPLQAYLAVDGSNRLYGSLDGVFEARGAENALSPGLIVLALAVAGVALAIGDHQLPTNDQRPTTEDKGKSWLRTARRLPRFGRSSFVVRRSSDIAFWVLLALIAFVLSLGAGLRWERGDQPLPVPMPYMLLYQHVPGLAALRVPARWGMLVSLAASVLAGLGAARLLAYDPRRARRYTKVSSENLATVAMSAPAAAPPSQVRAPRLRALRVLRGSPFGSVALGIALLAFVIAERVSAPIPLADKPDAAGAPPVYAWLAAPEQRDIGVVLELPLGRTPRGAELNRIAVRQYYQTIHWKALPISYSGVIPFGTTDLMARIQRLPDDDTLRYLRLAGVDTLVVHGAELEPARLRELLAAFDATPLLRRRADVGAATVYALQPSADLPGPDIAGASVYVSADERMPGPPVMGLLRRWRAEGRTLYGQGRTRYYAPLALARAGQVFDYGLLAEEEDPLTLGFHPSGLRWVSNGLAFYARDPQLRASLPLGRPIAGRFHPAHPAQIDLTVAPTRLLAGEAEVRWEQPIADPWLELDIASVTAQSLTAGEHTVPLQPGITTVALPAPPGAALRVAGAPGDTALLRVRVRDGPQQQVSPDGLAVAADVTFDGTVLRVAARAGGPGELLLEVRGAAAADERPVRLLEGIQPVPPDGGAWSFEVNLLRPSGPWLTHVGAPEDGRYIVSLKQLGREGAAGLPIAKFNIRGGALTDAEPVPLPLTAIR
jgi:hypothetical protein